MVFSMNVFKNKKRWKNKKNAKNVKKRALNKKNANNVFYIYGIFDPVVGNLAIPPPHQVCQWKLPLLGRQRKELNPHQTCFHKPNWFLKCVGSVGVNSSKTCSGPWQLLSSPPLFFPLFPYNSLLSHPFPSLPHRPSPSPFNGGLGISPPSECFCFDFTYTRRWVFLILLMYFGYKNNTLIQLVFLSVNFVSLCDKNLMKCSQNHRNSSYNVQCWTPISSLMG